MELLDHPLLSERYFFPRPGRPRHPFVVRVEGAELCCYRTPEPIADAPWLLHFHGNGEIVADWSDDFAATLERRGLNVFLAEYRGYGGSTGDPRMAAMLDDALSTADAVGCPPSRMIVYGRSVGSLYALHVAAHRPARGLLIESGIADVLERIALRVHADEVGATPDALRAAVARSFDHRAKIESFAGQVVLLHARHDHLVSPEHARRLAEWAGPRARLRLFDRGDHNSIHAENGAAIIDSIVELAKETAPR